MSIADEDERVQKNTFTKWINYHLEEVGYPSSSNPLFSAQLVGKSCRPLRGHKGRRTAMPFDRSFDRRGPGLSSSFLFPFWPTIDILFSTIPILFLSFSCHFPSVLSQPGHSSSVYVHPPLTPGLSECH